jgi:MFS family permease
LLAAVGISLLGLASNLGLIVVATLIRGVGTGLLWIFSSAILMGITDDRFRGRVFAFEFAALTLTQSIATLFAGMAVDRFQIDVQDVLLLIGGFALVVTAAWLLFLRWSKRQQTAAA